MDALPMLPTKIEASVAAGLLVAPLWVQLLQDVSLIASAIAALCGAILGLDAVIRLLRRSRR